MADAAEDHSWLTRLFAGEFGEDAFYNHIFVGTGLTGLNDEVSFLCLYLNEPRVRFIRTALERRTAADRVQYIQQFAFTPSQLSEMTTQIVVAIGVDDPAMVDQLLAVDRLAGRGLPVAFFSFLRHRDTGRPRVVFWCLTGVSIDWALRELQVLALSQDFS